jgi:23S rRNA (uracil1939-C5)-methyltransferase
LELIRFEIQDIDVFGQGISKIGGKTAFIPKTLIGEQGSARVIKEKKSYLIAQAVEIDVKSPDRVESACPHYDQCTGCHYLHYSYEDEISFKKKALKNHMRKLVSDDEFDKIIQVFPDVERFNYRNRIQLHYQKNESLLGQYSTSLKKNIPTPECKLADKLIQNRVEQIYNTAGVGEFLKKARKKEGHVEILLTPDNKVTIHFDKQYSSGGFTQVNQRANRVLLDFLGLSFRTHFKENDPVQIIDLFGGSGNLTKNLANSKCYVVDSFIKKESLSTHQIPIVMNLFKKGMLGTLAQKIENKPELMIVDPPRSGFKEFSLLVESIAPQMIYYISCNPSTLARDLENLMDFYQIESISLFDFFPATHHFETFVILKAYEQY